MRFIPITICTSQLFSSIRFLWFDKENNEYYISGDLPYNNGNLDYSINMLILADNPQKVNANDINNGFVYYINHIWKFTFGSKLLAQTQFSKEN